MRAALVPHPTTPSQHIGPVAADIGTDAQLLVVRYEVCGAIDKILWPEPAAATRSDNLWQHTCFELFVGSTDGPSYVEFNFSPSAQWAAYRFDGYRAGMREHTLDRMPHIVCRYGANRMYLEATLGRDALPRTSDARVRIGISAVIEDDATAKTYWALAHPEGKPDFHHADAFALELGHADAGIG
jgi:hypothetical protein